MNPRFFRVRRVRNLYDHPIMLNLNEKGPLECISSGGQSFVRGFPSWQDRARSNRGRLVEKSLKVFFSLGWN